LDLKIASRNLLQRKRAEDSYYEFVQQAWPVIEGGKPFIPGWHIEAACLHMEALYRGEILNLLMNMPPRMSKSTIVSVMFTPWVWIHNPSAQFLYTSYSGKLSLRDSRKSRQLIDSPWYQRRWGAGFQLVGDSNTKERFDNDKGGYRVATSVDAMATGEGGDFVIADDPNHTKDKSEVMLEATTDWWATTMSTRVNDFVKSRRMIVQQRTDERDLSGFLLDDPETPYVHVMLPMEFEEKRRCVTVALPGTKGKPWRDPRKKEGELLCPARIDREHLDRLKKEMLRGPGGTYAIAGQLQQRPAPAEGGLIKRSYFNIWRQTAFPKMEYTILSLDTGLTKEQTSAESVALTLGVFRDENKVPNIMLLSCWHERVEYPELRAMAQRLANDYLDDREEPRKSLHPKKPSLILIENKASGISLIQDLRRAGVFAQGFDPAKLGDKMQRVWLTTPILQAGRLWVPGRAPDYKEPRSWCEYVISQCITFPNAALRDAVDALSQALNHLTMWGFVYHPDDPVAEQKIREYEDESQDEPNFY
jgi:predicted phage terminase large subunit-like protein